MSRIYTGAFNSATSAGVVGATPDFVGNLIETGGASSGEHFNIPVPAVDVFVAVGGIPCTTFGSAPTGPRRLIGTRCAW